jgi:signal transduction histidine kinase
MHAMRASGLTRQYTLTAAALALLLTGSFALFAYLATEQLSRAYTEAVLLAGKNEAEQLARRLEGKEPLYKVVETRREELEKLSASLTRQRIVDSVAVFDENGKQVWQTRTTTEGLTGGFLDSHADLAVPSAPESVHETSRSYQIRVPLAEEGTVVFGISKATVAQRAAALRQHTLVSTAVSGGAALAIMLVAVAFMWRLVRRTIELEERRRMQDELAALGRLAANLAHEIRNPLNALSINLEMLAEDVPRQSEPAQTVDLARREVDRLSRLVNDFLVYARPAPPNREEFSGEELLADVASLLRPTCERLGIELTVESSAGVVRGDRGQLSQVLVNLALNAVQAMEPSAARRLWLRGLCQGGRVVFEVVDSGPGIPEAELKRVREAFYTRRKGGTGLGLAIADRIVGAHGGALELANRLDGGLVARVVLPTDFGNAAS